MGENGTNGHLTTMNGGLGGVAAPALDMTKGKDREYLRRAVTNGWPVNPSDMAWYYEQLRWAAEQAKGQGDAREVNACVRTMVAIVGQVQADQHLADKYDRIDRGDATERIGFTKYVALPEGEL